MAEWVKRMMKRDREAPGMWISTSSSISCTFLSASRRALSFAASAGELASAATVAAGSAGLLGCGAGSGGGGGGVMSSSMFLADTAA